MRGQIISLDFILAIGIFLALFVAIYSYSLSISNTGFQNLQNSDYSFSNLLVTQKLGTENALDCSKLSFISSENYTTLKGDLNVNQYDFYVSINGLSNSTCTGLNISSSFGMAPNSSAANVASVTRIVSIGKQVYQMNVELYGPVYG